MKQVLLIDGSPLFREFLKDKLVAEQVTVDTANGKRDAWTKLITTLPDLVIIDVEEGIEGLEDFFVQKMNDPNAKKIPIFLSGPQIDHSQTKQLVQYGIVKYFTKPIKFDVLFEAIGKVLNSTFSMDETPCVLDLHLNGDIIFVEVSEGLNREKIGLLKYKLPELINNNSLKNPKVVIMLTNLELSFIDGFNMEYLLDNILSDARIQPNNVKVLTMDEFAKDLIAGHQEYDGIETVTNLVSVLSSLVDSGPVTDVNDVMASKILASDGTAEKGSVEMRFRADGGSQEPEASMMRVAIVDDDIVIRNLLKGAFSAISAETFVYGSGIEFMNAVHSQEFDIVILDVYIPDVNGFDILKTLQRNNYKTPIIIYSQATQRDFVVQALRLGAKSYVVKPQKPDVIIKKALELINN